MSKILLSDEAIQQLRGNQNILSVSQKSINYTEAFKIKFITEYNTGKSARKIFEDAGLDIELIGGMKRVYNAGYKWRSFYKKDGIIGLQDTRKLHSGSPLDKTLSQESLLARKDAETKSLKAELELLKKLGRKERQVTKVNQSILKKHHLKNLVSYLCKVFGVSRSGYYHYLATQGFRVFREASDLKVKAIILKTFNRRGYKKGSRSIKMILKNELRIIYSLKRIRRIMKKYEIVCPHRCANPYKRMAKATKEHQIVKNKLNREFKQNQPGKVLLTDITHLPYGKNHMAYLSTIKDCATNEFLAYQLSDRITLDIATNTIHKLLRNKRVRLTEDAYIHSYQGAHYTSPRFQKLLAYYDLGQSMSRRGNC